ncbi:hypothetical protein [uncultured Algibacter sp.]|uniref:hypothetical protein n=1 Tax=uncultured Algibacter sp. TaxID=298659 RepID=UPI0026107FCC|nr:hypothetical protein [uncultured Algibacter sp.]
MLKKIVKHGKKLFIVFFLLLLCSTSILYKYRYHLKHLLVIRLYNTIEKDDEDLLAIFSFNDIEDSRLVQKSVHYKIKLVSSSGIPIDRADIEGIDNPEIPLIFTIETWGINGYLSFKNDEMESLYTGEYDAFFKEFCTLIIGHRPNVYFRLNPEMEVSSITFPWQGHLISYQKAFEYLSSLTNTHAPQVKHIFGGAGYPGVLEFYPDCDQVDVASVVLSPESEKPINYYPKYTSTYYNLFRRLHRLRFIDKPIFVFGSSDKDQATISPDILDSIKNQVYSEREVVYSKANFITSKKTYRADHINAFGFGLYDPNNLLNSETAVSVEHLFVDFSSLENGNFEKRFKAVLSRNHDIIVTFEPFRNPFGIEDMDVLNNVLKHNYDKDIEKLYAILLKTSNKVYLRYAHEMEIPIIRYPWQSQDPVTYIKSFRYFMSFKAELPRNIKRVWGPAGDRGSIEFWPGSDVVDVISFAIYGLPDKNITNPNKQLSFEKIFKMKKRRMRFIDKPIFITEFGVKGPEDYQTKWLENAAKILKNETQVIGANYFNMSDTPKAWGDIKPPDWSISKATLNLFINTLNEE